MLVFTDSSRAEHLPHGFCNAVIYAKAIASMDAPVVSRPSAPAPESTGGSPWVRVVIVNYNTGPLLSETIAGLASQFCAEFEAVIVDNASTDGSADFALPDSRFRLLPMGSNVGFAAGCNVGSRNARTPWLAMLNPDAIPDRD